MKKFLLIFFFLIGCVTTQTKVNNDSTTFGYNDDLSLNEFRIKLEAYSNNNPYPDIDN